MAVLKTLKFVSLTERFNDANFLSYQGNNLFQATAPYTANYSLLLSNESVAFDFIPHFSTINVVVPVGSGLTYLPKYQIYNIRYKLYGAGNMRLNFHEDTNVEGYGPLHFFSCNPGEWSSSQQYDNFLKYDYEMKYPTGLKFSELTFNGNPHIQFLFRGSPLSGYFNFSIKYYDKYLMDYVNS